MTGPDVVPDDDGLVRLHKLLARSGVASRRKCEELMLAGAVTVDGEVVTRLGTKIDPLTAVVRVEGRRLPPVSPHVYLVLNKPTGVVSTMSDPQGRPTLSDFVADRPERLFHVGRLDTDTAGLLLLTNDGEFAQRHGPPVVRGRQDVRRRGRRAGGQEDPRRPCSPVSSSTTVRSRCRRPGSSARVPADRSIVELVIHEGRNRIVRRLLEHVGHPVRRLTRTAVGPVQLTGLASGAIRDLTNDELGSLLDSAGL